MFGFSKSVIAEILEKCCTVAVPYQSFVRHIFCILRLKNSCCGLKGLVQFCHGGL